MIRVDSVTRNSSPQRLVTHKILELVEQQFVQPPIHIRAIFDGVANPTQILEHDDRVRELLGELNDGERHAVENPLRVSFFLVTECSVDAGLPVFLASLLYRVIPLATGLHRTVVDDQCAESLVCFAVECCERDVAFVDVNADERVCFFLGLEL